MTIGFPCKVRHFFKFYPTCRVSIRKCHYFCIIKKINNGYVTFNIFQPVGHDREDLRNDAADAERIAEFVSQVRTALDSGTCAGQCPVQAIDPENPRVTDGSKCIACCRCINVCPQKARRFGGVLYKMAGWKFVRDNARRLEPEWFV